MDNVLFVLDRFLAKYVSKAVFQFKYDSITLSMSLIFYYIVLIMGVFICVNYSVENVY